MHDAPQVPPRATAPSTSRDPDLDRLRRAEELVLQVVRGNQSAVRLVLASILAGGHVLLEDVPGVGKTTLARALARVLGCSFSRLQFTADLLPSDVIGVQVLDPRTGTLAFKRGPIFAEIVLADEINRASPKTQSALLEAMADLQVSVDDQTLRLPPPFVVLATQNPVEHHGTYPLPESQLDRFMIRLSLGYPPHAAERALILEGTTGDMALAQLEAVLDPPGVRALQERVRTVKLAEPVADYLLAVVEETRRHPEIELGCSPRGALAWAALCRARALIDGRAFAIPDDIKGTAEAALVHRLAIRGAPEGAESRRRAARVLTEILASVAVPR